MRWILSLLLAWPLTLFGAAGDITGVAIETNGWQALVYVNGLATNGTYASFGFGANNTISGNEKLIVNLTSQGYDNTGTVTTVPRTVYGTLRVRFPYPSDAYSDTLVVGSDVRLRIALSDWVYAGDSNITANISSGLYTSSGTPNASGSSLTVTNLSTQPYPKVIANWSWPGYNRETGSSMRLRAVGFHAHAKEGKPLAAMKFIATDESGDAVTSTQTEMTIDRTLPDIFPTGEYVADLSQSSFASLDRVRCDFIAYPWVGDSSAVLDTTANTYSQPTYLPASITNLCDRLNVYTDAIAVVATGGNDTSGQITNVAPASVDSAHYFATIAGACNKLDDYNNANFSHNDVGGGIIYVKNGIVNWTGATVTATTVPRAWVTVKNYPGDTVTLTGDTGSDDISDRVKIEGVTLGFATTTIPFFNTEQIWFNQCTFNSSGVGPFQNLKVAWATHCNVTNLTQGLRASSTQDTSWLTRGNNLDGFSTTIALRTTIGNNHPNTNGIAYKVVTDYSSGQASKPDYVICYNNYFGGFGVSGAAVDLGLNIAVTNGLALVQNVFEICTNQVADTHYNICSLNTLNYTNVLVHNNVWAGKRIAGVGYNDSGSAAAYRFLWSFKNNIFDNTGFKTDNYAAGPNANRIGNWPVMWNVGWSGNLYVECDTTGVDAPGSFNPEFAGLRSYHPSGSTTNIVDYPRYVLRLSQGSGASAPSGGGNYRTLSDAPGLIFQNGHILPFDFEGNYRGLSDPPGAYASAVPRKAAGFFSP